MRVFFKNIKSKKKKKKRNADNRGHNTLILFDTLPNFVFSTRETNRDYLQ